MDILIKNGRVLTMNPEREIIKGGDVAIEGNQIAEVGKDLGESADTVIDARGKAVLPGLVNTHTHLSMTLMRGFADDLPLIKWLKHKIWPLEENLTGKEAYAGAMLGCLEMIKSGTTCFADQYFFMDKVAQAVEKSGLRGMLSYGIIENGDPEKREKEIKKGTELVENFHGAANNRILTMYGPHSPYTCSTECLKEVKKLAEKKDVGIHIHLAESDEDIENTMEFQGERPVKHLAEIDFLGSDVLAAHCVKLTDEEIEIMNENNVNISHNPISNLKLASGMAPINQYLEENMSVGIGTDGCASNNNLDMFEEMKTCSLIHKIRENDPTVVSALETLEMATLGGAKALGLQDSIGSLEPGKKADIITVNLKKAHLTPLHDVVSHLVYSAKGHDVDTTIVDGKILMKNRKVLSLEEKNAIANGQEAAENLVKKLED